MKLIYEVNNSTSIEVECATVQEAIKNLTALRDSVGYENCGQCGNDTFLRHRTNADGDDFYEHVCSNLKCRAVLQLGTNKEGQTLYKKRMKTDKKGKAIKDGDKAVYLDKSGWGRYNPETKEVEY